MIASKLSIHPDQAFGLCFRFWSWLDDHMVDGNARGVTKELIDTLLDRSGFADALVLTGWLRDRNGSLEVPNMDRHLSQSAKQRALTSQRVAKCKAKKSNDEVTVDALPREEKRREEKIIRKEELPYFKAFNDLWCKSFKERFGAAYMFGAGRDALGTNALIKIEGYKIEQLMDIAKSSWNMTDEKRGWYSVKHSRTIHGFSTYFNNIRNEVGALKSSNMPSSSDLKAS